MTLCVAFVYVCNLYSGYNNNTRTYLLTYLYYILKTRDSSLLRPCFVAVMYLARSNAGSRI